jgi:hypothetical protein
MRGDPTAETADPPDDRIRRPGCHTADDRFGDIAIVPIQPCARRRALSLPPTSKRPSRGSPRAGVPFSRASCGGRLAPAPRAPSGRAPRGAAGERGSSKPGMCGRRGTVIACVQEDASCAELVGGGIVAPGTTVNPSASAGPTRCRRRQPAVGRDVPRGAGPPTVRDELRSDSRS